MCTFKFNKNLSDNKLFVLFFLILIFCFVIFFFNVKYGSFSGISSSYVKLSEKIEERGMVYDIIYEFKPLNFLSSNLNESSFVVEGASPYLPKDDLNRVVPSGYFLIDESGTISSKYPVYFSYISFFFKETLSVEIFYIIPFFGILFIILLFIILREFFENKYVLFGSLVFLSFSVLTSLFVGRFLREIPSLLFLYFSYYLFYKFYKLKNWKYFYLASVVLGVACSLRITNIVVLLPVAVLLYKEIFKFGFGFRFFIDNFKKLLISTGLFMTGFIAFIFQLVYPIFLFKKLFLPISGNVNALNPKFLITASKAHSESNIVVLLKYSIMELGPILFGVIFLYFIFKFRDEDKKPVFLSLVSFYLVFLFLFSSWVNPWPRYIIGSIPVLVIIFVWSFRKLEVFDKFFRVIFIFVTIFSLMMVAVVSNEMTHYWSEVYDENSYYNVTNVDNLIGDNSLILQDSMFSNDLGNQNLRGYFDSLIFKGDVIGIKELDFKLINEFCSGLDEMGYDSLYLLSDRGFSAYGFEFLNFVEINHKFIKRSYSLYKVSEERC